MYTLLFFCKLHFTSFYVHHLSWPPAVRIIPSLLDLRMLERMEAAGRSPTRELLWSWAQQNSRVQDLLKVLTDMGHHRALHLFQSRAQGQLQSQLRRNVYLRSAWLIFLIPYQTSVVQSFFRRKG